MLRRLLKMTFPNFQLRQVSKSKQGNSHIAGNLRHIGGFIERLTGYRYITAPQVSHADSQDGNTTKRPVVF